MLGVSGHWRDHIICCDKQLAYHIDHVARSVLGDKQRAYHDIVRHACSCLLAAGTCGSMAQIGECSGEAHGVRWRNAQHSACR